jgi:hypothetical protein
MGWEAEKGYTQLPEGGQHRGKKDLFMLTGGVDSGVDAPLYSGPSETAL